MKDIVITSKKLVRELWVLVGCFVAANVVNVCAIIGYDRPWSELYSQIGFVVTTSLLIYLLLWVLRGVVALLVCLFSRLKR